MLSEESNSCILLRKEETQPSSAAADAIISYNFNSSVTAAGSVRRECECCSCWSVYLRL